jgi:hypothetical protein
MSEEELEWHKRRQLSTQHGMSAASTTSLISSCQRSTSTSDGSSTIFSPCTSPQSLFSDDYFRNFGQGLSGTTSPPQISVQNHLTCESLVDPSRLLPILEHLGVGESMEEFQYELPNSRKLTVSFPIGSFQFIEQAADFFSPMSQDQHAFPVFVLSWLGRKDSASTSLNRIVSSVQAEKEDGDVELLQSLLTSLLSELEDKSSTGFEQFLLCIVLSMSYKLQHDESAFREQIRKSTSLYYGLDTFLSHLQSGRRNHDCEMQLNLISYYLVHLAFSFLGVGDSRQSICDVLDWGPLLQDNLEQTLEDQLKLLDHEFLCQVPGPFELSDGVLHNSYLRDCLKWCHSRLRETNQLSLSWKSLRQRFADRRQAETFAVYWLLWGQYQKRTNNWDTLTDWTKNPEAVMGVSATELLFHMASLIIQASPNGPRLSRLELPLFRKDLDLIDRAIAGGNVLMEQTDEVFARQLLSHLVDKDFPNHSPLESHSAELSHLALQTFRNGIQEVHFASHPVELTNEGQLPLRRFSHNPTLASSHSSSTLSSMRRLAAGTSARRSTTSGIFFRSTSTKSERTIDDLSDSLSTLTFPMDGPNQRSTHELHVTNP